MFSRPISKMGLLKAGTETLPCDDMYESERKPLVVQALVLNLIRNADLYPVIRERYLRDDVDCGIERCRECPGSDQTLLPVNGATEHTSFANGHFVLPDTNVFLAQVCRRSCFTGRLTWVYIPCHLHNSVISPTSALMTGTVLQMDLMESNLFTTPIILLQTVLEEVRHRSLPLYNRLKALTKMDGKRTWVFYNEYRS